MADVILHVETKKQVPAKWVDIRMLRSLFGSRAAQQLPVIHAISDCNTTSALSGHGKASVYKAIVSPMTSYPLTQTIMNDADATTSDIVTWASPVGSYLRWQRWRHSWPFAVCHLHEHCFQQYAAPRSERLPPTAAAAKSSFCSGQRWYPPLRDQNIEDGNLSKISIFLLQQISHRLLKNWWISSNVHADQKV